MPQPKIKYRIDEKRGKIIGHFNGLNDYYKKHPPRHTLCTIDESLFRDPVNKKGLRSETAQINFIEKLWEQKFKELSRGKAEKKKQKSRSRMVQDVMQEWLDVIGAHRSAETYRSYTYSVNYYIEAVGNHPIDEFKTEYDIRFKNYLAKIEKPDNKKKKHSINNQRKHIGDVQRFYNWAAEKGKCKVQVKFTRPSKVDRQIEIYSRQQIKDIGEYLLSQRIKTENNKRLARYVKNQIRTYNVITETGMRGGEIWSLLLTRIRLDRRLILIRYNDLVEWTPKGAREQEVPINKKLARFLEQDLAERNEDEIWFLDKGDGTLCYSSEDALAGPFGKINKELGIEMVKPLHGFRASVCTHLQEDGVHAQKVQKLLRHKNIETTLRHYTDTRKFDLHEVVEQISCATDAPQDIIVESKPKLIKSTI